MDIQQEIKKLNQEKTDLQSKKAVALSKINELSSALGIEPDLDKVIAKREELQSELQSAETELQELITEYNKLSNESGTETTDSGFEE